jgi:hypothetical protein
MLDALEYECEDVLCEPELDGAGSEGVLSRFRCCGWQRSDGTSVYEVQHHGSSGEREMRVA